MSSDQVTINQLVIGFCRTYYRFLGEDQGKDVQSRQRAYMALFETLNWTDAVDAFLRREPEVRGGNPKWPERLPLDQREVIEGVQHARNVVHHQWWDAIATEMKMEESGKSTLGFGVTCPTKIIATAIDAEALYQPAYPLPSDAPVD